MRSVCDVHGVQHVAVRPQDRACEAEERNKKIAAPEDVGGPISLSSTCPLGTSSGPFLSSESHPRPLNVLQSCVLVLRSSDGSLRLAASSTQTWARIFCRRPPGRCARLLPLRALSSRCPTGPTAPLASSVGMRPSPGPGPSKFFPVEDPSNILFLGQKQPKTFLRETPFCSERCSTYSNKRTP